MKSLMSNTGYNKHLCIFFFRTYHPIFLDKVTPIEIRYTLSLNALLLTKYEFKVLVVNFIQRYYSQSYFNIPEDIKDAILFNLTSGHPAILQYFASSQLQNDVTFSSYAFYWIIEWNLSHKKAEFVYLEVMVYSVSTTVVLENESISAYVNPVFSSAGFLDFYVKRNFCWRIEFTCKGSLLKKHVERFESDDVHEKKPNFWYILYDDNYRQITIIRKEYDDKVLILYSDEFDAIPDAILSNIKLMDYALWSDDVTGPCFGNDIVLYAKVGKSSDYDTFYCRNSSYEKKIRDSQGKFDIVDYEVFQVIKK
ncbi:hypothetical protein GLOIN_2v1848690 [Rhizophagus clarus]|uniref:TLDc domain-containing protein n=1 Tax=Rhizophagus clarus TaxID=94130 RepID=A0A8H3QVM5_9GLOM|nr:hypothetical protein GLOIN_2v1848690 [Rhizophagus clarus]